MAMKPEIASLEGLWIYRSLLDDPDLSAGFDELKFGRGNIEIEPAPMGVFRGRTFDTGWELQLAGSIGYGTQDPISGEGIVKALRSGFYAAYAVGDFGAENDRTLPGVSDGRLVHIS